jgi:hypothetical protein
MIPPLACVADVISAILFLIAGNIGKNI